MKIAIKEAKWNVYWQKVIKGNSDLDEETIKENKYLIDEVKQLQRLLSAIN